MAWEMFIETEVNATCLKFLKKLVNDVEKGKKILVRLTEEAEIQEIEFGAIVPFSSYTGKDTIIIKTERVMEKTDESN